MGEFFDIRITAFSAGLVSLVLCIILISIYVRRLTYAGFLFWTVAALLWFFGSILLSLRDYIPDFLSIVTANTLISISMMLMTYGLLRFSGVGLNKSYLLPVPIVVQVILFWYFTYIYPSVDARIMVISMVGIIYSFTALHISLNYIPRLLDTSNRPLTIILIFLVFFNTVRIAITGATHTVTSDFMQYPVIHKLGLLFLFITCFALYIEMIILNFQRLEIDLHRSMEEIDTLRGLLPICSFCNKIRDSKGEWKHIDKYIAEHTEVAFSHGICDDCMGKYYPNYNRE